MNFLSWKFIFNFILNHLTKKNQPNKKKLKHSEFFFEHVYIQNLQQIEIFLSNKIIWHQKQQVL
jgi:hypothetical protein